MKRWVFATDLHGDNQDPDAVGALHYFVRKFKPDIRIFGGDLFDFRPLRRNGSKGEQGESMAADVEAGMEFLKRFKPNVFLRGNHDERIFDIAKDDSAHGLLRDAAKEGCRDIEKLCRKLKCKMYPYDVNKGVYQLGKMKFIHGFHAGVNAARQHALVYAEDGGCVLHGHTHSIQAATIARLGGATGRSVGCLARLDMEYSRAHTARLAHAHGWAYGLTWNKGYEAYQAKKIGKQWIFATSIEEYYE